MIELDFTVPIFSTMIDTLKAMAIFAEVVKRGSFREAGKSLSLSPSVISYHVSRLEEKTGTALLYRSTRSLTLSHEGEAFYRHVLQMLDAANQGIAQLSSNQSEPSGTLKLSLPTALAASWLTDSIAEFCFDFPKMNIEMNYSDTLSHIIDERVDLTIRASNLADSNYKATSIGFIERTLVCTPSFYSKHEQPRNPEDLANWRWIKLSQLSNQRTFKFGKQSVDITFNSQLTVNSVEAIRYFCLKGVGLASLATSQVNEDIENGRLCKVLPKWRIETIPLYAIWAINTPEASNTKLLLSYLKAR